MDSPIRPVSINVGFQGLVLEKNEPMAMVGNLEIKLKKSGGEEKGIPSFAD